MHLHVRYSWDYGGPIVSFDFIGLFFYFYAFILNLVSVLRWRFCLMLWV